jgi:hypothetical protein
MPGMEVEEWFSPYGLVALVVEGAFIMLFLIRPWKPVPVKGENSSPTWFRYGLPIFALLLMGLMVASAYLWDAALGEAGHGHQPLVNVEDLQSTPQMTLKSLEQQYGVQVSLVAVTALDSIVDVRLKIIDSEKAHELLENHAAILVNNDTLIQAANMHRHSLREGKIYVIYYPNHQNLVGNGTSVSLVFGDMHLEPVTAQ